MSLSCSPLLCSSKGSPDPSQILLPSDFFPSNFPDLNIPDFLYFSVVQDLSIQRLTRRAGASSRTTTMSSSIIAKEPEVYDEWLPEELEFLRPYIPLGLTEPLQDRLFPMHPAPGVRQDAMLVLLNNPTHSAPGDSTRAVVVNNLIVMFQTFLFFVEFIPNSDNFLPTQDTGIHSRAFASDIDTIKMEMSFLLPGDGIEAYKTTDILDLMDHYQVAHWDKIHAVVEWENGIFPKINYDAKTKLLYDLMWKWHDFRKNYQYHMPRVFVTVDTHDMRLASRLIQWREVKQGDKKHELFEKIVVPDWPFHDRVLAKDAGTFSCLVTAHDGISPPMTSPFNSFEITPIVRARTNLWAYNHRCRAAQAHIRPHDHEPWTSAMGHRTASRWEEQPQ